jgi:hypothetical protein
MSQQNQWRRVGLMLSGTALKRWYKKFMRRRNRRAAKQNPLNRDKRLDPWDLD